MKAENYILTSETVLNNAIMRLRELVCDGKLRLTIHNAGDRSIKQNALLWLWNTEVANSGKGSYDTKEAVHRSVKLRWVIPVLIRDDPQFAELYAAWKGLHGGDVDRMNYFVDDHVSTSTLSTHQMAEVLTDYQRQYAEHGIHLSDPEDLKNLYFERDHVKD